MARSFDQLPARMDRLGNRVLSSGTRLVRQVATAIGATVVDTTRVDTGAARSNWVATLNAPASGVIPPYAPGNKLGPSEIANATGAKAQQKQVIERFDARKHDGVFITNNIPYIETLNNGGGNIRTPGLMVEQGLQTGRLVLQSIKALDRR